jgi:tartrate dehydrogenase/decarboxylase/D-malate dehydrogenase
MSRKRIAVIPGDGIGKEVMPEGVRVMEAAASKFGIDLAFDHFDFASWDYCEKHGKMMPDNWKDQVGGHDAIYFGAVGWPEKIPDHVSLWGSLLLFRREFDQYVNLRPARLMPGIIAPVVRRDGSARQPGEIDMYIVRENTEGEYSSIGGRMYPGTAREIVMQETVMSRVGVDRVLKFAFDLAQSRPKKHLTSATKSNGIAITMPYWDERVEEMAKAYPGVKVDKFHIDILSAHFVQRPDFFDVVVASNLFGDILSDLGPACTGTIGRLTQALPPCTCTARISTSLSDMVSTDCWCSTFDKAPIWLRSSAACSNSSLSACCIMRVSSAASTAWVSPRRKASALRTSCS